METKTNGEVLVRFGSVFRNNLLITKHALVVVVILFLNVSPLNGKFTSLEASEGLCPVPGSLPVAEHANYPWLLIGRRYYVPMASRHAIHKYAEVFLGRPAKDQYELNRMNLHVEHILGKYRKTGFDRQFRQLCLAEKRTGRKFPRNLLERQCHVIRSWLAGEGTDVSLMETSLDTIVWTDNHTAILVTKCINHMYYDWEVYSIGKTLLPHVRDQILSIVKFLGFSLDNVLYYDYDYQKFYEEHPIHHFHAGHPHPHEPPLHHELPPAYDLLAPAFKPFPSIYPSPSGSLPPKTATVVIEHHHHIADDPNHPSLNQVQLDSEHRPQVRYSTKLRQMNQLSRHLKPAASSAVPATHTPVVVHASHGHKNHVQSQEKKVRVIQERPKSYYARDVKSTPETNKNYPAPVEFTKVKLVEHHYQMSAEPEPTKITHHMQQDPLPTSSYLKEPSVSRPTVSHVSVERLPEIPSTVSTARRIPIHSTSPVRFIQAVHSQPTSSSQMMSDSHRLLEQSKKFAFAVNQQTAIQQLYSNPVVQSHVLPTQMTTTHGQGYVSLQPHHYQYYIPMIPVPAMSSDHETSADTSVASDYSSVADTSERDDDSYPASYVYEPQTEDEEYFSNYPIMKVHKRNTKLEDADVPKNGTRTLGRRRLLNLSFSDGKI